jgi:hypothetical protein
MSSSTIETKEQVLGHLKMEAYANLITVERFNNLDALAHGGSCIMKSISLFGRIAKIEDTPLPKYVTGNPERIKHCKWVVSEDRSIILPVYLGD